MPACSKHNSMHYRCKLRRSCCLYGRHMCIRCMFLLSECPKWMWWYSNYLNDSADNHNHIHRYVDLVSYVWLWDRICKSGLYSKLIDVPIAGPTTTAATTASTTTTTTTTTGENLLLQNSLIVKYITFNWQHYANIPPQNQGSCVPINQSCQNNADCCAGLGLACKGGQGGKKCRTWVNWVLVSW